MELEQTSELVCVFCSMLDVQGIDVVCLEESLSEQEVAGSHGLTGIFIIRL